VTIACNIGAEPKQPEHLTTISRAGRLAAEALAEISTDASWRYVHSAALILGNGLCAPGSRSIGLDT
jgi:hypothetical protein